MIWLILIILFTAANISAMEQLIVLNRHNQWRFSDTWLTWETGFWNLDAWHTYQGLKLWLVAISYAYNVVWHNAPLSFIIFRNVDNIAIICSDFLLLLITMFAFYQIRNWAMHWYLILPKFRPPWWKVPFK